MNRRKIISITGIRSDYDLMSSVFREINKREEFDFKLIITGTHLSPSYGMSINEIKKDGFIVADVIESLIDSDSLSSRAKGMSIQMQCIIQTLVREKPDLLLVLGDREEAITTAVLGTYMNIPIAHVSGGDKSGTVDDPIRHSVTKLSHLHFATNDESLKRIIKLGEESWRVFNVGNPGLDRFIEVPDISSQILFQELKLPITHDEKIVLVIQHPVSSEINESYEQMKITLEAVNELNLKTIIIHPNSDAGSFETIKAINKFNKLNNFFSLQNLPREQFINIFRRISCLVGNSSAGILEASFLKKPVINIGSRQKGRLSTENIQHVDYSKEEILNALKKSIFDKEYINFVDKSKCPYGEGDSSKKIVEILLKFIDDKRLLNKKITY
tara:strand:+ start:9815 stop:10972 length:1158 start_codon:yes stop_codon:yes gene_type:complete